jgi:WD40 repeat protein
MVGLLRLVYYLLYSEDFEMPSKVAFDPEEPSLGFIRVDRVAPPQTLSSILRYISRVEGNPALSSANLFANISCDTPLTEGHISNFQAGSLADDPMAVVIGNSPPMACDGTEGPSTANPPHTLIPLKSFSPTSSQWQGHMTYVDSIVFSPDGTQIASGSGDRTIYIWDRVTTGQLATTSIEAASYVYSVAFSPDGRRIVSGCNNSPYIQMWEVVTRTPVSLLFEGHTRSVFSIAFSPDGRWIASGSADHTVRIWDAHLGKNLDGPMNGHTHWIRSITFSPDGLRIASGSDDTTVRVWNSKNGQLVAGPFQGHSKLIYSITFSPNGRWVVSGSYDQDIRVWDTEDGTKIGSAYTTSRCFKRNSHWAKSIAFGPDGRWIVSGSPGGAVRIWNFKTGQEISTFSLTKDAVSNGDKVWTVAISPKGDCIVAGTIGGRIYTWKRQ